jgi:Tfp pilus assembly major pilin PilA
MPIKEQMRTGKSITLIQLIISVVVVLSGAVGLYVKNAVDRKGLEDRVAAIELYQTKQDAKASSRVESRNAEIKALDERIDKNTQDIEIIKIQKQDKK